MSLGLKSCVSKFKKKFCLEQMHLDKQGVWTPKGPNQKWTKSWYDVLNVSSMKSYISKNGSLILERNDYMVATIKPSQKM